MVGVNPAAAEPRALATDGVVTNGAETTALPESTSRDTVGQHNDGRLAESQDEDNVSYTRELPLRPKVQQQASIHESSGDRDGDDDKAQSDKDSHSEREKSHASARRLHAASDLKHKILDKTESIKDKNNPPGGFDQTPLPDFPAGYTLKITFHRATNLPIADVTSASSDPFIRATLTADVPKRHKEDPDLVFRTRTIRRDTEPRWEQEWIVANVPRSGFRLKCRLYDEDYPDHDDRLGNVTYHSPAGLDEGWPGVKRQIFEVKKRMGSKRAYLLKAVGSVFSKHVSMTPLLELSFEIIGRSEGPGAQMCTVGPTSWIQHFSPMIGRLTGVRVNKNELDDEKGSHGSGGSDSESEGGEDCGEPNDQKKKKDGAGAAEGDDDDGRKTKKYDFQANEIQLQGPVPPRMYHRYVEFKGFVAPMFLSDGLRGKVLNKMLHKQHRRVYNFDSTTKYGYFEPCSTEAAVQFLRLVHFDEGGRLFTYVLTLDGLLRFTETGKEFGIDLLSKHTMHSDVQTYIACSGEFFVRRNPDGRFRGRHKKHATSSSRPPASSQHQQPQAPSLEEAQQQQQSQPQTPTPDDGAAEAGKPAKDAEEATHADPSQYELVIDNDSGTYRPDKSILPDLQAFLEKNFPSLRVTTMHCGDEHLQELKKAQLEAKKRSGKTVRMVLNRSPSASSFSSSDESRLSDLGRYEDHDAGDGGAGSRRSKKEIAWDVLEDPRRIGELRGSLGLAGKAEHHHYRQEGEMKKG